MAFSFLVYKTLIFIFVSESPLYTLFALLNNTGEEV